jgi:hypothetical protein
MGAIVYRHRSLPQSSSFSRFTAAHAGFFDLSQSGERLERQGESFRFDTMPSRPLLQAWANTVGPSPSMCSLNRMPGPAIGQGGGKRRSLGPATPKNQGRPKGRWTPARPFPFPPDPPGGRSSKSVSVFYGWLGAA